MKDTRETNGCTDVPLNDRRNKLKKITLGAVMVGTITESSWIKPVINSVILPAHAVTSSVTTSTTSTTSTTPRIETTPTPSSCNVISRDAGNGDAVEVVNLAATSGTLYLIYDTQVARDQVLVRYEGKVLFDSGCVGTNGDKSATIPYSGSSMVVTIEVVGSCNKPRGNTAWTWSLTCA